MASAALDFSPVPIVRQTDASTPSGAASQTNAAIKAVENPEQGFGFSDFFAMV